jgi:hypothetical protein
MEFTKGPWKWKFDEYAGYDCMDPGFNVYRNGESWSDLVFTIEGSGSEEKRIAEICVAALNAAEESK